MHFCKVVGTCNGEIETIRMYVFVGGINLRTLNICGDPNNP